MNCALKIKTICLIMRCCLICFQLLCFILLSAQTGTIKTRKVVPLYTQQDFFLNGGLRGNLGGKSRATYQVTLPPGTVEWYYTVTTAAGTPNQSLNLLPQLTKLMDPTGVTSILASTILAPSGANAIDCLLMPTQYENAFMQMSDIASVPRFPPDSRLNFRSGTIQVRDIIQPGSYSIGFRNPSVSTGIGVSFEAAAIVEETTSNPDGENAINYGNLGWKAFENGDISKCIEYSKKALALDNNLGYVKANLGLCFLC